MRDELHENFVIEDQLAASTVNLKVFFWVNTLDYRRASRVLRGLIIKQVKEALDKADFNLPSDVVELKLYKNTPEIPFKISGKAEKELPKK